MTNGHYKRYCARPTWDRHSLFSSAYQHLSGVLRPEPSPFQDRGNRDHDLRVQDRRARPPSASGSERRRPEGARPTVPSPQASTAANRRPTGCEPAVRTAAATCPWPCFRAPYHEIRGTNSACSGAACGQGLGWLQRKTPSPRRPRPSDRLSLARPRPANDRFS